MNRLADRTYFWVLKSTKVSGMLRDTYWVDRGRWPAPMGWRDPKVFLTKNDADEWLFNNHINKGRDVSFVEPRKIHRNNLKCWYYL